ncbi:Histidine kinase-, DNA gyrase B-, and HSP90-like ATPase [Duganella sacchari]|uniref:Histidine kinase-, DNA gyrase B-, and HSP90-like ATPase n=1 Tax=Duganella sacchari TaxID=551987 RepID=A0A1M7NZ79_9BURK|nr:sensor histidine kinase [Duganella sacchari]SHN09145.1 Histidine kinase-, DNA gyrase B-, and HSP90-like ATPase [Duganella sacchari]
MANLFRIFCLLALLIGAPGAWALDSKVTLNDYHHDIWTGKDGAPGEISSMAQTADGWLWIGSSNGLYRFDGMRFRRFEALPGEVAPQRPITALTALRNGDLVIGYIYGGISVLSKGHLTHSPSMLGGTLLGPVSSAAMDQNGVLWAATGHGLLQLANHEWRNVGKALGVPPGRVSNLIIDQYDQIWLAAGQQLLMLAKGGQRFRTVLSGYGVINLSESPDGRLWLDTRDKLVPVPPQHRGPDKPRPAWLAQSEGQENGLFDRDGNYWMLACPGVCRSDGLGSGPATTLTPAAHPDSRLDQPWQLSSLTGNILFEDRDGSMWVGTQAGVERFRNNRLTQARLNGGERFLSFARDSSGHVLAWAKPTGEIWQLSKDAPARVVERGAAGNFGVLGNAADGALLVAGVDHIERRYADKTERIAYPPDPDKPSGDVPVARIMDDGRALWVTISRRGTFRWHDGRWQTQAELGLPPGIFFAAPGAPGAMWFGYNDGVVLHFDQGRITRYAPQGDHDVGAITFLHGGDEVIAGGSAGLAVLRGGQFRRIGAIDPEVLSRVSGMVIAANGDHWFNGGKGVVSVRAADWQAAVAAPDKPLKYVLYGVLDGYPGFAATAIRLPSAIADADGQLWFAGVSGIAQLDSTRVYPAPHPPQVKIETLVAQGNRYLDFAQPVTLAPGTTSFRIEYTALSYTMPEGLRFRYRLEGVDADWQDPGARRAVSYTNLGPGDYRFRVAAVNQFGQWNDEEASIAVRILPTFTQTRWFYALCALGVAGVLYLLYLLWLRQATMRFATRMAERERIARALHDSFLQSVHGLTMSFQTALSGLPEDSVARQKIERVLLLADKVMEEGRDEVQDLRSGAMGNGDLAHGLTLVGEVLQESHGSVFSLRTAGTPRTLESQAACEAYSVAREAIMNAFRHAQASTIQVELNYGDDQFMVQVLDDGKGIDADVIRNGRTGHWGLTGLFERAARIGGHIAIDHRAGGGTRVMLTVPAACAYAGQARWKRYIPRWLSR